MPRDPGALVSAGAVLGLVAVVALVARPVGLVPVASADRYIVYSAPAAEVRLGVDRPPASSAAAPPVRVPEPLPSLDLSAMTGLLRTSLARLAGEEPAPVVAAAPLAAPPPSAALGAYRHEFQGLNNCGPVTAMMVLSLHAIPATQAQLAAVLKPGPNDKNVTMPEIARYLETLGLRAPIRVAGDHATLKRLVAAGIPVIVQQQLTPGDDIGHYRLMAAYDDAAAVFTVGDSYLGPRHRIGYAEFDRLWGMYHNAYMPVFRGDQEGAVREILGESWDGDANWRLALRRAEGEIARGQEDGYAWWRLGQALHAVGRYSEAWDAFQESIQRGLQARHFWYQFTVFETLVARSDWVALEQLTQRALAGYATNPEVLTYRGMALEGLGRPAEALALYRLALLNDPQNQLAQRALERAGGGAGQAAVGMT